MTEVKTQYLTGSELFLLFFFVVIDYNLLISPLILAKVSI